MDHGSLLSEPEYMSYKCRDLSLIPASHDLLNSAVCIWLYLPSTSNCGLIRPAL